MFTGAEERLTDQLVDAQAAGSGTKQRGGGLFTRTRGKSGPSTPNRTSAPPVLVHSPPTSIFSEMLTDLKTLLRLLSRPDAPQATLTDHLPTMLLSLHVNH